jgi:SAM-dependent methyltransferase
MPTITQYEPYAALADVYHVAGFAAYSEQIAPLLLNLVFDYNWVGSAALDLGCGTGELACYLAEQGLRTFGVDLSREMLAHAQQTAQPKGLTVDWQYGDLRTYHPDARFDLVTCLGALNLLPTLADVEAAFKVVATALGAGKFFIFDLLTIKGLAGRAGDHLVHNSEQAFVITHGAFSYETLALTEIYHILTHNGMEWRRAEEKHTLRGYPAGGLSRILAKYNLRLLRTLDTSFRPADPAEADKIVLLAQKEGG